MPSYTFKCTPCSLVFQRRLASGSNLEHKCPSCSEAAPRHWEGQNITHSFGYSAGTAKANSGVAEHDYPTAENIAGRSSEMRWARIHARNKVKEGLGTKAVARIDSVENGNAVSEYRPLTSEGFKARKALENATRERINQHGLITPRLPDKPR